MNSVSKDRSAALRDLVELRRPVPVAIAELSRFSWDSETDLIFIEPVNVLNVLDEYARGTLAERDLIGWAEALDARDDVGFVAADAQLLRTALFELSAPELFGPIGEVVSSIRARLGD